MDRNDPAYGNLRVLPVRGQDVFDAWMDLENGLADGSRLMRLCALPLTTTGSSSLRRWFGLHLVVHRTPNPEKMYMYGPGATARALFCGSFVPFVTDAAVAPLQLADLRVSGQTSRNWLAHSA